MIMHTSSSQPSYSLPVYTSLKSVEASNTHDPQPVLPGAWLGILGGGQLGRMFCFAAQALGYRVAVLDPDPESPAGKIAEQHVCAGYSDLEALDAFAQKCQAISTEFENVPAATLEHLARITRVAPAAPCVALAQDRIAEKRFLVELGLPVAPYLEIASHEDCARFTPEAFQAVLPGILKTARLGYDGRGQIRVSTAEEVLKAHADLHGVPCVLEKRVDIDCEISVLLARAVNGANVLYPLAQNKHQDGILIQTQVPAPDISKVQGEQACEIALKIADSLEYVGVLCVEFFVLKDHTLCVNEMAPRPHNSGHYTVDACVTNQFEQQVRAMAGLPLGATHQHSAAVMLNILGNSWFDGQGSEITELSERDEDAESALIAPRWAEIAGVPGAHLHLYGKTQPKRGRKMGHVTLTASTLEASRLHAQECAQILHMVDAQ